MLILYRLKILSDLMFCEKRLCSHYHQQNGGRCATHGRRHFSGLRTVFAVNRILFSMNRIAVRGVTETRTHTNNLFYKTGEVLYGSETVALIFWSLSLSSSSRCELCLAPSLSSHCLWVASPHSLWPPLLFTVFRRCVYTERKSWTSYRPGEGAGSVTRVSLAYCAMCCVVRKSAICSMCETCVFFEYFSCCMHKCAWVKANGAHVSTSMSTIYKRGRRHTKY